MFVAQQITIYKIKFLCYRNIKNTINKKNQYYYKNKLKLNKTS